MYLNYVVQGDLEATQGHLKKERLVIQATLAPQVIRETKGSRDGLVFQFKTI